MEIPKVRCNPRHRLHSPVATLCPEPRQAFGDRAGDRPRQEPVPASVCTHHRVRARSRRALLQYPLPERAGVAPNPSLEQPKSDRTEKNSHREKEKKNGVNACDRPVVSGWPCKSHGGTTGQ